MLQDNEIVIMQVMVTYLHDEWMIGGLDQNGLFHRLNDEEMSLEMGMRIIGGAGRIEGDAYFSAKDWVNDQLYDLLNPEG